MSTYHRPPDGYEPPSRCEQCGATIIYGPVIGGLAWTHVGADHQVVMRPEGWWDVATGTWRTGIFDAFLESALAAPRAEVGEEAGRG